MANIRRIAEELIRCSSEREKKLLEELKHYNIQIAQRKDLVQQNKLRQRFFRK